MVSLGYGPDGKRIRRKVSGKTRAVVQERLRALHSDLDSGVRASPNYTVRRAAQDWLAEGLDGRSAKTVKKNENVLAPILTAIGSRRLRETADDVRQALTAARFRRCPPILELCGAEAGFVQPKHWSGRFSAITVCRSVTGSVVNSPPPRNVMPGLPVSELWVTLV